MKTTPRSPCVGFRSREPGSGREPRHAAGRVAHAADVANRCRCGHEPKAVYVCESAAHWRQRLGVGPAPPLASDPLRPTDGPDGAAWAAAEVGGASLGDARLRARLVAVAGLPGEDPMAFLPAAVKGNRARIKGCYRFIDRPDGLAVPPSAILHHTAHARFSACGQSRWCRASGTARISLSQCVRGARVLV